MKRSITIFLIIGLIAFWVVSQRKVPEVTDTFLSYDTADTYGP